MGKRPKIKKFEKSVEPVELGDSATAETVFDANEKTLKTTKKKKNKQPEEERTPSTKPLNAINYLKSWSQNKKSNWKFKKTHHVWLLRHWKNKELLTEEDFTTFVKYMAKDQSKKKLIDECTSLIDSSVADEEVLNRAKNLVQSI